MVTAYPIEDFSKAADLTKIHKYEEIQQVLREHGRADLADDALLAWAFTDRSRDVGGVHLTEDFLGAVDLTKTDSLKQIHGLLLNHDRRDLVGDIMLAYAFISKENGHDLAWGIHVIEAAAAYFEHGRSNARNALLDWLYAPANDAHAMNGPAI